MKKRILSILLTLVMVIGMLPAASLTAHAMDSSVHFNLIISDTLVGDIHGTAAGEGWTYDGTGLVPRITLNNYEGSGIDIFGLTESEDFYITVKGDCKISGDDSGISNYAPKKSVNSMFYLTLEDNAKLTMTSGQGIYNDVDHPTIRINGDGQIDIATSKYAFYCCGVGDESNGYAGMVNVSGNVELSAAGIVHVGWLEKGSNNLMHDNEPRFYVSFGATVSLKSDREVLPGYSGSSNSFPKLVLPENYIQVVKDNGKELHIFTPKFKDQTPPGSDGETTGQNVMVGEPQTYTFNSNTAPDGYYVEKTATLKGLFAGLDADKTVTVKDGSPATLEHTFGKAGLYELKETLKLYKEGESTPAATKTHVFLISVSNAPAILDGIEITWSAASMAHANGQKFDKSKIEVTANYSDGSSKILDAADYDVQYQNGAALKTGDTYVTIRYYEDGVTKTVQQPVSVADALHAFEFKSLDDLDFGTVEVGYPSVAYKNIIVKNTGSDFINLDYKISDTSKFRLSPYSDDLNAIEEGTSHTLQVYPVDGLPAGVYNETIRVYGLGALAGQEHTFNLKFVVSDGHEHTYTTDFNKSNEFYHWRECTNPTCTASDKGRKDVTPHNWDIEHPVVVDPATCTEDGVSKIECTICDAYQNITVYATGHNWGEWNNGDPIITPPCTAANDLVIYRTCNNANCPVETESKTISRIHMAMDWTTDETHHWKVCGYCETEILVEKDAHKDTNSDNKCDTCEYPMTPAVAPTEITEIVITGVNAPVVGGDVTAAPSYALPDDANYEVESAQWMHGINDQAVSSFIEGNDYRAVFNVVPKEGYKFGSEPTMTINGENASVRFNIDTAASIFIKLTAVAEGGDTPAPEKTAGPTITYDEETLTVTATGAGTVTLKVDDVDVANPYTFEKVDAEKTYVITATAKEEGKTISETATLEVTVPAKEAVTPDPDPTKYTVSVSADPVAGGTVTGAGEYEEGASATVTATAAEGYEFVNWTVEGEQVSTDASYTFEVTGSVELVAVFEAKTPAPEKTATPTITYEVTDNAVIITAAGNGTVKLYAEGMDTPVNNPYIIPRGETEITVGFTATAQEEGKDISETATLSVTVPAKVVTPEPAQKYTITYTDGVAGKEIFADVVFTDVEEGSATPTISNPTRSGYTFTGWTPAVAATVTGNQTYTATWDKNSTGGGVVIPTVFPVNVKDSDNGEVKASAKYAAPGSTIKLTVTPDEGYELDTLIVKSGSKFINVTEKNGKYQFVMPFGSATVTATFKKIETPVVPVVPTFDDVAEDTYYFDAVEWAVKEGITSGTTASTFSPDMTCTRAQAVTFLWRAAGSPEPKSNVMPFEDVAAEAYYYKAVLWAVENGITKGTSETTFSPDADCTRAQIVTFLWRAQKSPAADSVNPFTDVAADAYYVDAVLWAVEEKVTKGTSETTFSPDADCTRAQIVTFLYRALNEQ